VSALEKKADVQGILIPSYIAQLPPDSV